MSSDSASAVRCPHCGANRPANAAFCSKCGTPNRRTSSSDAGAATSNAIANLKQNAASRGSASRTWSTVLLWSVCGAVVLAAAFALGCYHQYTLDCIALNPNRWVPDSPTVLYQRAIEWRDGGVVTGAVLGGVAGFFKTVIDGRRERQ
jgi:hypothetical protein